MEHFLFYPRERIAKIGENNEEKIEKSIVKKTKKNIDVSEETPTKEFISKPKKHGNRG